MNNKDTIVFAVFTCSIILNTYLVIKGSTSVILPISLVLTLLAILMMIVRLRYINAKAYIYYYRGKEFFVQEYYYFIFSKRFIIQYLVKDTNLNRGKVLTLELKDHIDTDILDIIIDQSSEVGWELVDFEDDFKEQLAKL